MNKETLIALLLGIALFAGGLFTLNKNQNSPKENKKIINTNIDPTGSIEKEDMPATAAANKNFDKPKMEIDQNKNYIATMETSLGTIKIQLNAKETPITVNNFVYLARQNYYDETIFHRTIDGFMIQGGDPRGDGTGGPGYKFDDEKFEGEYTRGTIAMANAGPDTNGSQFFIMHQDYPLPPNYVIFGKVIEGLDIVDDIATAEVEMNFSGEMSKPVDPVVVKSVLIEEN